MVTFATPAIAFVSAAYTWGGGVVREIKEEFVASTETVTLGLSLFVLDFAVAGCKGL